MAHRRQRRRAKFRHAVIEVEPGIIFAPRAYPWEHGIYVLAGEEVLLGVGGEQPLTLSHAFFVPPDEAHGYRNTGDQTLKFICVVPNPKA